MVEVLERIAEREGSASISGGKAYSEITEYRNESVQGDKGYFTFAEMYLEKPTEVQAGFSVTVCTWRGVPTIDDW